MDIGLYELSDPIFWRSVFAELVATTFFLFFAVSVVVYRGLFGLDTTQLTSNNYGGAARSGIAFGFGFSIFVLAFVFAPVSGANMNPAVSLGLMLCKKISITRAIVYSLAQMLGASLGTLICKNIDPAVFVAQSGAVNVMAAGVPARGGLLAEFMATMFLVLVVLSAVDESRKHKTLPYVPILAPFAIGTAVVVCHLALVPIDGEQRLRRFRRYRRYVAYPPFPPSLRRRLLNQPGSQLRPRTGHRQLEGSVGLLGWTGFGGDRRQHPPPLR